MSLKIQQLVKQKVQLQKLLNANVAIQHIKSKKLYKKERAGNRFQLASLFD